MAKWGLWLDATLKSHLVGVQHEVFKFDLLDTSMNEIRTTSVMLCAGCFELSITLEKKKKKTISDRLLINNCYNSGWCSTKMQEKQTGT